MNCPQTTITSANKPDSEISAGLPVFEDKKWQS
jgi:hypothetical protein